MSRPVRIRSQLFLKLFASCEQSHRERERNIVGKVHVSAVTLRSPNGSGIEIGDYDDGDVSIRTDGGNVFWFHSSEVEMVLSVIRDIAEKSAKRASGNDSVEPASQSTISGRSRRGK